MDEIVLRHDKLDAVREDLRMRIPELHEFIHLCSDDETAALSDEIRRTDGVELDKFAWLLSKDRMPYLFCVLKSKRDKDLESKILRILYLRRTRSLFFLNWLYLTENIKHENLWNALKQFSGFLERRYPDICRETLFFKLGDDFDNMIRRSIDLMETENADIAGFFAKYMIGETSAFAEKFCTFYFTECKYEGFERNYAYFVRNKSILGYKAVLKNYLNLFEPSEYRDEALLPVYDTYGIDFSGSEYWNGFSAKAKQQFQEWANLWRIGLFFGQGAPKALIWKRYHGEMVNVTYQEDTETLFIYFLRFVVVVPDPRGEKLYLYRKNEFINRFISRAENSESANAAEPLKESKPRAGKQKSWAFQELDKNVTVSAHDAIILNKTSNIFVMTYKEVGLLYIRDLIDRELARKR